MVELKTKSGLTLRLLTPDDARSLFNLIQQNKDHLNQEEIGIFGNYPTLESVLSVFEKPPYPDELNFGIWEGDKLTGTIYLKPILAHLAEVGFWVGQEFLGRGIATESVKAVIEHAQTKKLFRIMARVHYKNLISQRVLYKAGFRIDVITEGDYVQFSYVRRRAAR